MASHSYPPTSSYCTLYRWSTAPDSLISWFGGRSVWSTFLQTIWGMGLKGQIKLTEFRLKESVKYPSVYAKAFILWALVQQCIDTKMKTYFPRAKHSNVILEASMAVVSGNFTLMSAGYFLSPEAKKKNVIDQKLFNMLRGFSCYAAAQLFTNPHRGVRGWGGWTWRKHFSQWWG